MALKIIAACSVLLTSCVASAATLELPKDTYIMALNGKEVEKEALQNLSVGSNQFVVEFIANLDDGKDRRLLNSKPYIFEVDIKNSSDKLELSHKHFFNYSHAENAFKNNDVDWKIETNGRSKSVDVELLPGKEGFLPYSDIEQVIRNYNVSQGVILSTADNGTGVVKEAAVTVSETGKVEITGDATTQLKLWYSKATKAERKEFRKWMIDQE